MERQCFGDLILRLSLPSLQIVRQGLVGGVSLLG